MWLGPRRRWLALAPLLLLGAPCRAVVASAPVMPAAFVVDQETIFGLRNLSNGHPARNDDESVNAVVEIPSGTTAKFEVDDKGVLRWARKREDGRRREIDYLAFPVNYGMVPRTLAEDGDPLDVLVLGRGLERAAVVRTRMIGVLKMGHDGIRDDKLVAVPIEGDTRNGFSDLTDIHELDLRYPASRDILVLWFSNYWGRGATHVLGWGDADEASTILDRALTRARNE